jgi:hypothetical protein
MLTGTSEGEDMATTTLYRDQQAWKDLQQFLPERLRLDEKTAPVE